MSTGQAVPGTSVPASSLVSPGGAQGQPGPIAASSNAGNVATVGSDGLIYVPDPMPTIQSVRLRSFNSVGNPSFEVDQRSVGGVVTAAAGTNNAFVMDRWSYGKVAATGACSLQQTAINTLVPGTSFQISKRMLRVTVTTVQASLAAGEYLQIVQNVEGINWRELIADTHSISLLVQSSVAGLKFSVALQDNPPTQSIVYLCTIPSAGTPTLITLPNIPIWPAGNFAWGAGNIGYRIVVNLGAGTTFTAPAAGSWQSGNFAAASTTSNFLASAVNSTFDLMFIQHEPGSQCTTLIDKPFTQNYDECLRYYAKSYPYATKAGTASVQAGLVTGNVPANFLTGVYANINFPKPMAKIPTLFPYAYDGTANGITLIGGGTTGLASYNQIGETGFGGVTLSAAGTSNNSYQFHYVADTGW